MSENKYLVKIFFITILFSLAFSSAYGQCVYMGQIGNGYQQITVSANYYGICREVYFGYPFSARKINRLYFDSVTMNCRNDNILVYNENRQLIYNFCSQPSWYITVKGVHLIVDFIIRSTGSITAKLNYTTFSIENSEQSTTLATTIITTRPDTTPSSTTNTAPATTTTAPATTTTTTTTTAPATTTTTTTTRPITATSATTLVTTTAGGVVNSASLSDYSVCGLPSPLYVPKDSEMRIINGVEAIPNSWPWQVYIEDDAYSCGAILINNLWLLTAAHCTAGALGQVKAYIGFHDIRLAKKSLPNVISKIINHPNYNPNNQTVNDIALLKLSTPVTFNDKIKPICLPNSQTAVAGRVAMVTGWGMINNISASAVLRQVAVPINSLSECSKIFGRLYSTQLCAGVTTGTIKDSCQGDSGGPLFTKEVNNYVLAGIVSFGGEVCDGYGVYTNVFSYIDWIKEKIRTN